MNVARALERATAVLPRRRGLPDPGREALFLLAAAWGVDEVRLRMRPGDFVPPEVEVRFFRWVDRRREGEPAEHLVGRCDFWGRSFVVTPSVLIPRPETELIVQAVLERTLPPGARVADVGTGSGCLAVTLAVERPGWTVVGMDRSLEALQIARHNGKNLGADVKWLRSDLASSCRSGFDLVVANLPYVPSSWLPSLGEEIAREPEQALDGGADGLDLVRRLIGDLGRLLVPGGSCFLELAEGQAEVVEDLAVKQGLSPAGRRRDIGGCDRVVVVRA